MNLIANAVDAILGRETRKDRLTTSQTAEDFLISVRDTGAGIPEAIRSKIFDPFFTTKPIGQGTGLGLAISYGIVQDHGGSIEVQSEEGVGTEFIVRIPLDLESQRGKMKEKLLVLDDEAAHPDVARTSLRRRLRGLYGRRRRDGSRGWRRNTTSPSSCAMNACPG